MSEPQLSKLEIRKDSVQSAVEAMADTVHDVSGILTGAVKQVVSSLGGLATELFEIRDQARRAAADTGEVEPYDIDSTGDVADTDR